MGKQIELYVPGRLCLFGEHSDWAGMYRSTNSALKKGQAIVTGIEQVMDAFYKTGRLLVSIMEVPADKVVHYGILHGIWPYCGPRYYKGKVRHERISSQCGML